MILVPGTALAQDNTDPNNPLNGVVNQIRGVAGQIGGAAPSAGPSVPGVPSVPGAPSLPGTPSLPGLPGLPGGGGQGGQGSGDQTPVSNDDSPGHVTPTPQEPDHGSGHVGLINLTDKDILDLTRYDATVENDGTTHSDSRVLGLLGNQIVGSGASSNGENRTGENITEGIGKATNGAISLALLYHDTYATQDNNASSAGARGGLLALCLGGKDPASTTSYECQGPIQLGAAEGLGLADRDKASGHTQTQSGNEAANLCLGGTRDSLTDACKGPLGLQALHADSASKSSGPDTTRHSYLLGFDSNGKSVFQLSQPAGLALPPGCGEPSVLCLFLNQGRSFLFPNGASSGQEALDLNLLKGTPLDILVSLGEAESIAHQVPGNNGGGPKPPECSDKIDNDGDGKIDYPADPDCTSPSDNSEAGNGGGNGGGNAGNGGGLASTGAEVAPLLAGAFLLIGAGSLTVAATRRRVGKHTV